MIMSRILLLSLLACVFVVKAKHVVQLSGPHVCVHKIAYPQVYTVSYTQVYTYHYYESCYWWFFMKCKQTRSATRKAYKKMTRLSYRIERRCCPGWKQIGLRCTQAICRSCVRGTCIEPNVCACYPGFSGTSCDKDLNECQQSNGGCEQVCNNIFGSFKCECQSGYVLEANKRSCSDHDECATSSHKCMHRCVNYEGRYACECDEGYQIQQDGSSCTEINECSSNPCGQICIDLVNMFECSCEVGYRLSMDKTNCEAICLQGCGNGGYCEKPGKCSCSYGWKGNSCDQPICQDGCHNGECVQPNECICGSGWQGISCDTDVDECAKNNGGCDHLCTNELGGFQCSCKPGYILSENGLACSDHDECGADDHGCDYCVNTNGSYMCICPDGYVLDNADGKTCMDVNECLSQPCGQECVNTVGSFFCECQQGYYLDANTVSCLDVDECTLNQHNCQHKCVNTNAWYRCECEQGFELHSDGISCTDINECEDSELNTCQQECYNTEGTFECKCSTGYAKSGDICEAVCKPSCANDGICVGPGTCKCDSGWQGSSCVDDVDECLDGTNRCSHNCTNVLGGYLCFCPVGYNLVQGHKCIDVDECANTTNNKCQFRCDNTEGSYVCSCDEGFVLDTNGFSCSDHDECAQENHGCDYCANTLGSYSCFCPKNYYMQENGKSCSPVCSPECSNGGICFAPGICKCTSRWRGERCNWEVTGSHWTRNTTGCQCYFNKNQFDCACCEVGGCQCTSQRRDRCVQCGYGIKCENKYDEENQRGVDSWTLSEQGCPCLHDKDDFSCACCQNGGCPCGNAAQNRCMQCGLLHQCESKKPWEN